MPTRKCPGSRTTRYAAAVRVLRHFLRGVDTVAKDELSPKRDPGTRWMRTDSKRWLQQSQQALSHPVLHPTCCVVV